jgi:hypothetical protein
MNVSLKPAYSEIFVALARTQIARQVNFYSTLLASSPKLQTASYAEFHLLGLRLALFTPKANHQLEFTAAHSGAMSLCLEVSDLERLIDHLKTLGYAPPGKIIYSSHGQEIYAYDPDGNRIILHQSA